MEDKKIELSISLVNGILQYLSTRPYQEVFQLIQGIESQASAQFSAPDANNQAPE